MPAGDGWKNPSVVGKHEAGYGMQPCREVIGLAGIYGVLVGMKRGPELLRGADHWCE